MNMSAINEAGIASRGRRLAMACVAVFGAMLMVGPALGADLPYDYPYGNDYSYNDYGGHTPCCEYYRNPCCHNPCCDLQDSGGRWWGPAINVHVNVPFERRREGGWVERKYTERRYSDDSPYPEEYRQYKSVRRYELPPDDYRYEEPAAFDRYDYRYADTPAPWAYRSAYFERERRRSFYEEPVVRPPGLVPGW